MSRQSRSGVLEVNRDAAGNCIEKRMTEAARHFKRPSKIEPYPLGSLPLRITHLSIKLSS